MTDPPALAFANEIKEDNGAAALFLCHCVFVSDVLANNVAVQSYWQCYYGQHSKNNFNLGICSAVNFALIFFCGFCAGGYSMIEFRTFIAK